MKLQHLIILFLVIMLPLALIMSEYTALQIDTLAKKTKYDTALLGATFDTMAAFELNTRSSETSSVPGEEIRDLEAMISTFTNSLSTSLDITGVSNDYIMSYVPAMVFTLYDGYYIYAINEVSGEKELKPYVYYTKTYINGDTNITISYSLDNYVSIYGTYNGKDISEAGYLIVPERVTISPDFTYATNGDGAYVVDPGGKSWIKYHYNDNNHDDYVYIGEEIIYENEPVEETRGVVTDQAETTTDAMLYYYEAKKFTEEVYNPIINTLGANDKEILYIHKGNGTNKGNDPENEESLFLNEKINVMKDSITKNLNAAIYNYDGAVAINYEMPQLNGEDWDKILNDVAIIAFMKNMTIGTTTYNNYVVVNSTTNKKYVSAKSIDFIAYDSLGNSKGYYHNITCDSLIQNIANGYNVIGYPSVDFKRYKYSPEDENAYYYYYKHNEYADYNCEVKASKRENVATIKSVIESKGLSNDVKDKVLKTYYTSVGRIRYRLIKASSYINMSDITKNFKVIYHKNKGSWPPGTETDIDGNVPVTSEYGKIRVNQVEPSILGYKFIGWGLTETQTEPNIRTGDVLYLENNNVLKLYAIYSKQYKVTYNLNGGIGGPTPTEQTKLTDVDFIISKKEPTRANKIFMGWTKTPIGPDDSIDGITVDYPVGYEYIYTDNADLNLYAVWADEMVEINYYSAGSHAGTQRKLVDATISLLNESDIPENEGYRFLGWTTRVGNPVEYQSGANGGMYSGNTDLKLYAVWEIITYRITFDPNGGNPLEEDFINPDKCIKIYGLSYIIPNGIPTRTNYTFKGWDLDSAATIGEYQPGGEFAIEGDNTLFAIWEGDTYKIVYDANGGSGAPPESDPKPKAQEGGIPISGIKPIREGHEFVGWSTDKYARETEVEYKYGDEYTGKTTIKLYAIWRKATYTIEYMANGEVFETDEKTYGIKRPIISAEPTKEGYDFIGWSETEGGTLDYLSGQAFNNDSLARDGIIRLYAVWFSNDETVYSIEYLANGGENAPEGEVLAQGQTSIKISSFEPTRTGYTFLGWSTDQNATEADTRFTRNTDCSIDVLKENADTDNVLRLYAVWSPNELTLTVDPDGGTWQGSTAVQILTLSAGEEREIEAVSKNGMNSYWQVVEGDAEIINTFENNKIAKQVLKMGTQNVTIRPVWTEGYYTLTYDANGGTGAPPQEQRQYNKTESLSTQKPTKDRYQFLGWATTSTATSASWGAGGLYKMPAKDTTLYAVWAKSKYTLTYDANGGTGAPPAEQRRWDSTSALSTTEPTREGYIFKGWATTNSATTAAYAPGANFTMPEANTTLYAVWEIKTYTITYDANGGSGAPSAQTKNHGENLTLSSKAPTRTNYTFKGWATSNTATTATYQPGGTYTANESATLYAVWEVSVTNISLDSTSAWIYYQKDPDNSDTTKGTTTFTATLTPSGSTATITWSSSNTSVATVNSSGKVTAVGPGRTTITATAGSCTVTATVTVYNAVLNGGDMYYTRPSVNSDYTGALEAYSGGAKLVLADKGSSYYQILYYTNGGYNWGSGDYFLIGSSNKTKHFVNYGAW